MPTMTEGEKCVVDVSKQVVGKRSILSPRYFVSLFTTEEKRRFVDGTYPKLFQEGDHV